MTTNLSLYLVLAVLLWQPWIFVTAKRIFKSGDIIVGGLMPLHVRTSDDKCGEFFRYGLDYVEAMIYAIHQVNKDPKILPNGVTIGYDIRDFCDSPSLAMREAYNITTSNHMIEFFQENINSTHAQNCDLGESVGQTGHPVVAIIGPVDSSSCLVVANLLKVVKIPAISAFATSEELSSEFESFFRTVPSDNQQAKAMADIIEYFNWSYVAVIAVDHSYGRYGIRALEQEAYTRGTFCLATTGFFPQSGYEEKIKGIIFDLKRRQNIQVIILWSTYTPGIRVIKEAANQRLHGRTWLISEGLAMQGPEFFGVEEKQVVDGFIGILHPKFKDKLFEDYLRSIREKNNESLHLSNPWWMEFHDLITKNNSKKNNTLLNNPHLSSGYNAYIIDAVYAIAHALDGIYRCQSSNTSLHACPPISPYVRPKELIPFIKRVDFQGLTGEVRFDSQGDPLSSSYDIINFHIGSSAHARSEYVQVATWNAARLERLNMSESRIKWGKSDNKKKPTSVCRTLCPPGNRQTKTTACCWECIRCPDGTVNDVYGSPNCTECPKLKKPNRKRTECTNLPVTNLRLGDPTGIVYLTLTLIGMVLVIFTLVIFIKHRNTPVVKSSDRNLSFVLLIGIWFCYIIALLYLISPSAILCKILQPGRYLVYTICVSVLLVKTNRIVRLFALKSILSWVNHMSIDSKGQFGLLFALNVFQIVLGSVWLVYDPPVHKIEVHALVSMWYSCSHYETSTQVILEAGMVSYMVFLSCFCTFYAFKARKLPENYNEARYIGFSMYILVFSWISFYPVRSAVEGNVFVHIACTTMLVSAYGMLGCLFCPKLYIILIHPEKNTAAFVKASVVDYSIRSVSKLSLSTSKSSIAKS